MVAPGSDQTIVDEFAFIRKCRLILTERFAQLACQSGSRAKQATAEFVSWVNQLLADFHFYRNKQPADNQAWTSKTEEG